MAKSQSNDLGTPTNKDANSTDAMECVDPESIRTKAERPQIGIIPVTAVQPPHLTSKHRLYPEHAADHEKSAVTAGPNEAGVQAKSDAAEPGTVSEELTE